MIDPREFNPKRPSPGSADYDHSPELVRAVQVAVATGRPLLLRGSPGTGKTTLARSVAKELGASYYEEVVTSGTEARDLEWRFDAIQRLCDAQANDTVLREKVRDTANYIVPRALWWAFDPLSAATYGTGNRTDPGRLFGAQLGDRAVVLIDEIDKAEPQVTNDLLEPFDGKGFTIGESGVRIRRTRDVVLIVTTNEEKDLPPAFLRRCVVFRIPVPDAATLTRIGRAHFVDRRAPDELLEPLAELTVRFQDEAQKMRLREPATAEFLDAVQACATLAIDAHSPEWSAVTRLALWKHDTDQKGRDSGYTKATE